MTDSPHILEPARLKALAHPLRLQLLNALGTYGPATASGLADRLGESSGATSYHLRQLEKHGFVHEVADRGNARERWWERVPGSISLDPTEYAPDTAERAAAEVALSEWQRERQQVMSDFLRLGPSRLPDEWGDAAAISTVNVPLTVAQLAELSQELVDIADRYIQKYRGQRGEGVRQVRIHVDAFPVVDPQQAPGASPASRPDVSGGA